MSFFRKFLKLVLSFLARWAIKKHQIELVVVTGFYGSEIVREGIYEILNQNFKVRRNIDQIIWDMSLPLAVLGYADKRRNIFGWLLLIFRATFYLIGGPSNKHTLVLNANCTFTQTAKFWASFLRPDYLLVLNYEKDSPVMDSLTSNIKEGETVLIYDKDKVDQSKLKNLDVKKKFTFGTKDVDFQYDQKGRSLKYKDKKLKVPSIVPFVIIPHIAAVFAFCMNHGLTFEETGFEALRFDLGSILVKRIEKNLEKKGPN